MSLLRHGVNKQLKPKLLSNDHRQYIYPKLIYLHLYAELFHMDFSRGDW